MPVNFAKSTSNKDGFKGQCRDCRFVLERTTGSASTFVQEGEPLMRAVYERHPNGFDVIRRLETVTV